MEDEKKAELMRRGRSAGASTIPNRERFALYAKYADITIKCADLTQEEVCARIIDRAGFPQKA